MQHHALYIFFLRYQLLTAFWLWILPCVYLTIVSCPLKADRPDLHQQIKNCQLRPAAALQRIFTWNWTKTLPCFDPTEGSSSKWFSFVICEVWFVFFNRNFHKTPQNTAYSTVYIVLLCLGSRAVTAQLSLSLIKYWTRGIGEKLRAEGEKSQLWI